MNTTPTLTHDRALVLGGGGSAGNAWLIGIVAGLLDAGHDVTDADLVVGTSAGATAAAQVTGASATDLYRQILDAPAPPNRERGGGVPNATAAANLQRTRDLIAASSGVDDLQRRIGAVALAAAATGDPAQQEQRRAAVAARLPRPEWPRQRLIITAIDAESGELLVLDRESGVDLADAVNASTANGTASFPPPRLGGRYLIDGGHRSAENADLAAGCRRVLVLSPFGGRTLQPLEWGSNLAAHVAQLRSAGSTVQTVFPDAASTEAFGDNMMDLSRRAPAARAGFDQGRNLDVSEFLTGPPS